MKPIFKKHPLPLRSIVTGALIAAAYAALTLLFAPISYGLTQFRISEALTILPYFTPAAVPGLFVGCLLANLLGGNGPWDVVLGSLATLLAAFATHKLRKAPAIWAPLPPVVVNALVVGPMLHYLFALGASVWICIASVFVGQAVVCYGLGLPVLLAIRKFWHKIKL